MSLRHRVNVTPVPKTVARGNAGDSGEVGILIPYRVNNHTGLSVQRGVRGVSATSDNGHTNTYELRKERKPA